MLCWHWICSNIVWCFCRVGSQMVQQYLSWEHTKLGLVSISDKTSYCKISQSLEAVRFVLFFRIVQSLWNLTGTLTVMLPICPWHLKSLWWFKLPILQLRHFTRSYDKTSYRILKQGPDICHFFRIYYVCLPEQPEASREAGWESEFIPLKKSEVVSFSLLHKISQTACCFGICTLLKQYNCYESASIWYNDHQYLAK